MDAATILLRIRRMLWITRAELARLAQLSPSTIGRIEKGTLDPTWGTLTRILESTGCLISADRVIPTGDASAALAGRIVLEHILSTAETSKNPLRAFEVESLDTVELDARRSDIDPEAVQAWLERWRRAKWLRSKPYIDELMKMPIVAGVISSLELRRVQRLSVGDRRQWRELALRIDEAGFGYAVSGLIAPPHAPESPALTAPTIYVHDPAAIAVHRGWEESPAGLGMHLVPAQGLELEGTVTDRGIRYTSPAQALMDGFAGSRGDAEAAKAALFRMLLARP